MKWKEEEYRYCIELLKEGKTYEEIGIILGRSKKSIRSKILKSGESYEKYNKKEKIIKVCLNCGDVLEKKHQTKFCSSSCSATYNNKLRDKKYKNCLYCDNEIESHKKYCNSQCTGNHKRKIIFERIENGDLTLPSKNYKNYLIEKHGEKCMECGWGEKNEYSGNIPIELEHIDGDSENNRLDNLKLLCPNCHSLTPTYKGLNTGNGRHYRRERYKNGKSF
jgi:hypothetical protein